MATTISIEVGGQKASVDYAADDAKVKKTLLRYEEIRGLAAENATDGERIEAIIHEWVGHMKDTVNRYELDQRQADVVKTIEAEYGLE